MKNLLKKILERKLLSGAIAIALVAGSYFGYTKIFSDGGIVRYATAQAQKGTLIVSLSGTGQVSVSNQVDIKPKASGDVVYVGVKNGQEVKAGALIAQLDARDAQKAVRDAETNLESAKLSLEKLKEPADTLSTLQAENALAQAQQSKQKAEEDLKKAYEDGFNTIANAFLDLPGVMAGLQDMLFSSTLGGGGQWNIDYYANIVQNYDDGVALRLRDDVHTKYRAAREAYDKNFTDYKSASRFSDEKTIEQLITQTYDTTKLIAEAVKSTNNLIQFYQDKLTERNFKPVAGSDTHLASLSSYTGTTNSNLLSLLSIKTTIQTSEDAIVNADRSIAEKTESLAKLKAGTDVLDIQSSELTVKQRENALLDAKEKLADYYVRAPFAGVIAETDVQKGDLVSPASVLAMLITRQKFAEVSLNEVDVAKVKVGQKATLTFDAIPDLTIAGQVSEIDTVGTASQGVVTYNIKIAFDTQDERVKPAMSVSAAIVTEAKPNVLLVPNSAVKSQGGVSYVEMVGGDDRNIALAANASGAILKNSPRRQQIEVGTASDEFTEVTSGLNEGDVIVTRTIQPNAGQTQTQQQELLKIPGLPGGRPGGGGGR